MGRQVYENLKVLDVTNNYAGPMAGAMLADYGAEVWHVEKPVLGDDNRYFPPIIDGISINYCTSNRGKKSVVLDLKDPRGAEAFRKLAAQADVLLESYRPGVMKKLGLDYETLKEINPRLIYCSISAYGQEGPYANRPGYDVIAQAVSCSGKRLGCTDLMLPSGIGNQTRSPSPRSSAIPISPLNSPSALSLREIITGRPSYQRECLGSVIARRRLSICSSCSFTPLTP